MPYMHMHASYIAPCMHEQPSMTCLHACRLRHIYMVTDASPIPRPLLVHWPRKGRHLRAQIPGYLQNVDVTPHFVQPNHVEFRPAVEWRHFSATWDRLKRKVHAGHADELAAIMQAYVEVRERMFALHAAANTCLLGCNGPFLKVKSCSNAMMVAEHSSA